MSLNQLLFLLDIGFLTFRVWDILDIVIVGYLMFRIYKLLRGSVAFNIFIGLVLLYLVWWLVGVLQMDLLSLILSQFVSVGVIMLIIIFQPEVRKFLLFLGKSTRESRPHLFQRFFSSGLNSREDLILIVEELRKALSALSKSKTGALIVLTGNDNIDSIEETGTKLDSDIRDSLILSIFQKASPLHDGAMVINSNRISAVACILPISHSQALPANSGLRHRAAVGVTESTDGIAFVVSEENGEISYAQEGKLNLHLSEAEVYLVLEKHLIGPDSQVSGN